MASPYVFPSREDRSWDPKDQHLGITLRDYMAAYAMSGLLVNRDKAESAVVLSKRAYTFADAMIKESSKLK